MSIGIMAVLLLGALLHAIWNALIRAGSDKTLNTLLIVAGAGLVTACWLPFVPAPAVASWPYLAASVLIHVVYFTFVALSYRSADLSFAYPIMRGTAPTRRAAMTAARPTAPIPKTAMLAPFETLSEFITVPAPVSRPQPSGDRTSRGRIFENLDEVGTQGQILQLIIKQTSTANNHPSELSQMKDTELK